MLAKLINDSPYLAVLFYSDDEETCPDCEEVLDGLEEIDEEVDSFGIDLVKCKDPEAARAHSIFWLPTLALFRRKTPILYDLSDLKDQAKVLEWLTSNEMFELKDEIEEVNRKLLEKLMDQHDYIAVYFCKLLDNWPTIHSCMELPKPSTTTKSITNTKAKQKQKSGKK